MDVRRVRAHLGLALLGVVVLGGCGGAAESASDDESTPAQPVQSAPAQEPAATPDATPTAEPAAVQPEPAATAPPAATTPARQPAPRPAAERPRVIPAGSYPSTPVEPRPDAERTTPSAEPRREVRTLAAGRTLDLTVEAEVSTQSSREGDVVYATVSEDILGSAGEVLLPAGTRLTGRVAESRESTGPDQPAVLRLEFQSVTVNGTERPLKATVVEMTVDAQARDSNTRTAAKVGVGAAAGAIAGRILGGDRRDAVKGAVIGGVAGTAAAIATRSGHATLEPGARIVIRLEEALVVDG